MLYSSNNKEIIYSYVVDSYGWREYKVEEHAHAEK